MDRNKWAFWLFVLAVFLAASVPSTMLLGALKRYRRALPGFEPPLRPIQVRFTPHLEDSAPLPNLEFIAFRLKAPQAKSVELIGDFNGWKRGSLALSRQDSQWEVIVPLPPGRYRYLFVVDGDPRQDPASAESSPAPEGQRASVRSVH